MILVTASALQYCRQVGQLFEVLILGLELIFVVLQLRAPPIGREFAEGGVVRWRQQVGIRPTALAAPAFYRRQSASCWTGGTVRRR